MVAWFLLNLLAPIRLASNWLDDLRIAYFSQPTEGQHPEIVVVSITEETFARLPYRSPIDREFLAELIARLAAMRVRAVGLDILMDQPTEPAADVHLLESIRMFPGPVVVAAGDSNTHLTARQLEFQSSYLDGIPIGLAGLLKTDGVVRWYYPGHTSNNGRQPSFIGALAAELGLDAPTEPTHIVYRAPTEAGQAPFRSFPAHTIELLPAHWFRDKIVLIGADLPFEDRHKTPISLRNDELGSTAGVLIHANALAQFLDGTPHPAVGRFTELVILAIAVICGFLIGSCIYSLVAIVGTTVGALLAYWVLSVWAMASLNLLLPLMLPTLGLILAVGLTIVVERRDEWRQRKFLRDALSRYVSDAVAQEISSDPAKLSLGGEKRELSFIFTDIADFTALVESQPPERIVSMMREYLDGLVKVTAQYEGTIARFIGDALFILFGAPARQPDHADRAVQCALAIDDYCEDFRHRMAAEGMDFGITRIGVHTGEAVVGNVGGDSRFEYTAHGDSVNVTARLETANKQLGTRVCIGRSTAARSSESELRPVGELKLKGKSVLINVVTTWAGCSAEAKAAYRNAFSMLAESGDRALDSFTNLHATWPDDSLITLHWQRLRDGGHGAIIELGGG